MQIHVSAFNFSHNISTLLKEKKIYKYTTKLNLYKNITRKFIVNFLLLVKKWTVFIFCKWGFTLKTSLKDKSAQNKIYFHEPAKIVQLPSFINQYISNNYRSVLFTTFGSRIGLSKGKYIIDRIFCYSLSWQI